MSSRRPTLQDVADQAGVAKSTVSMALNDHPRIPKDTVARIAAVARKLGYRPDPVLSAMARNRWRTQSGAETGRVLAYVHDLPPSRRLATVDRFKGARREAERLGYRLEGFSLKDVERSVKRLAEVLRTRAIRGVLFDSMLSPEQFVEFPWRETATVWCGTHAEAVLTHTIELEAFRRFEEAWERVRVAGARRVGLVVLEAGPDERWEVSIAAFKACCERAGAAHIPVLDLRNVPKAAHGVAMADWLKAQPDVVIASDNVVERLLREQGRRVPEEIGFVSLHLWPVGSDASGFSAMLEEQGEAAVRLLHHDLLNHQLGLPVNPLVVTIKARWQEGRTLRTP